MTDQGQISIKIELFGIGALEGHLIRHIAPFSADAIINKLPIILRGRFSFGSKKYWTLPGIEIYKGLNRKSVSEVKEGDIVYNPKNDELIITIEALEMSNKVNIVGKVMSNLELLLKARNGLNTKILRV
ncbi:MAG: hypothetical protein KAT66_02175 [Candidatus Lokiarchaeota archaeon]|nr:hypothetical protein [Candidatus Lokiarchaeota archaeon]